jgi:hypothetical protein
MLERGAAQERGNDSPSSGELQELKDENQRLRRLLSLLHTYSLRLQAQRDALVAHRDKLLDPCEAIACRMREDYRVDEYSESLMEQLDDAIGESQKHKCA